MSCERGNMASSESGRTLPKFGEWDVNDPATAEGFTVIFSKAGEDKKTGGASNRSVSQRKPDNGKPTSKKWLCFTFS
ncbi:PREDICTED: RPM1-interacting protein 4 [Tarenaya hassleriana]|uniref:RPM1-interacting protein 4 n=1 Tax=Tarenaya hassleriana TaxID=28532 RepID=UPI00053C940E|nr:PREDICTED: RPM1-interacting protein 4 [Tarenaya hassleriana]